MNRRVTRWPKVESDLVDQAGYIARDNLDAALRFLSAAEDAIEFLAENPRAGASREYLNPALKELRFWPIRGFEKHLIFYRVTAKGIEIVRVLHAAQDIAAILNLER